MSGNCEHVRGLRTTEWVVGAEGRPGGVPADPARRFLPWRPKLPGPVAFEWTVRIRLPLQPVLVWRSCGRAAASEAEICSG